MAARPSVRRRRNEFNGEVNLIPLMNVFCILIPFLLLTAVFVQLSVIDTQLPTSGSTATPVPGNDSPTPTPPPKLNLTVWIRFPDLQADREGGFTLAGYGGVLAVEGEGEEAQEAKDAKTIIPMKKIGTDRNGQDILDYDYDKLQEHLKKVKEAYPGHYSIILLPDREVLYETIIKVLDYSREYREKQSDGTVKTKELFINPVLAFGMAQ